MSILRTTHDWIVREQLCKHRGEELQLQGDGFLLAFRDPVLPLRGGILLQWIFAERNRTAEEPIRVRVDLRTAEATRDVDKFFGLSVILASRIVSQVDGEQILVSADTKNACDAQLDLGFDAGTAYSLKGLADEYTLHLVQWQ